MSVLRSKYFKVLFPSSLLLLVALGVLEFSPVLNSQAEAPVPVKPVENVVQKQPVREISPEASLRLIALGDPGSGVKQQYDMAAQMTAYYDQHPFKAALVLGDNIYPDGDVDNLGELRFNKPYRPLREERHIPFIVALGNHDIVRGNIPKQLKFYQMPNRYYSKTLNDNGMGLEVFVLDTNTFANDKAQIAWLDKALGESKAYWKIVTGHHPIYSSGLHGNNSGLIKTLKPLLEKHRVPLYLAGHDHNYERFAPVNGVTYLISGGAGAYLRPMKIQKPGSLRKESVFHFMAIEATPAQLHLDAINRDGKTFDKFDIRTSVTSSQ
ncbi:MAG: metallophosphoesterase [Vampirovibrionales bacterium]|nr:metallophosphoesterase [Vampirovibrionales bacterium]